MPNVITLLNGDVSSTIYNNMFTFTCIFVYITLFLTALATLFLTLSLLSDEWEYMSYDPDQVETIAQAYNHSVEWLPGRVARIDKSTDSKQRIFYLIPAYGGVNKLCADIAGRCTIKNIFCEITKTLISQIVHRTSQK